MSLSAKDFENSVFTYLISNRKCDDVLLSEKDNIFGWYIYASKLTNVNISSNSKDAVVVIGYCVDSRAEIIREDIPNFLLNLENGAFESAISRLAGKYVIMHIKDNAAKVYADATATLPVYYFFKNNTAYFSSHEFFIVQQTHTAINNQAVSILKKGDSSKTLPYNISRYKDISVLLPNHFYSTYDNDIHRFDYHTCSDFDCSADNAAKLTLPLITNIACEVAGDYNINCPLTGGYDSRVVFGVFYKLLQGKFNTYTMQHSMDERDADLSVPKKISSDYNSDYCVIKDSCVTSSDIAKCDEIYGKDTYSLQTLKNILTLLPIYDNKKCLVNGDIVGQIGKSSLHRSIRNCFMGPAYYQCKIHNTSRITRVYMKEWYNSAKKYASEKVCERFNEEIRLGRWAADENSMYSLFGINVINIFNCPDIIRIWQQVPRKLRKNSELHISILKLIDEKMLKYEFSASASLVEKIAKKNDVIFYIATFAKYFFQVIKNLK